MNNEASNNAPSTRQHHEHDNTSYETNMYGSNHEKSRKISLVQAKNPRNMLVIDAFRGLLSRTRPLISNLFIVLIVRSHHSHHFILIIVTHKQTCFMRYKTSDGIADRSIYQTTRGFVDCKSGTETNRWTKSNFQSNHQHISYRSI